MEVVERAPLRAGMAAYLRRIGVRDNPVPNASSLAELQEAHLATIPFESLSIHLDEPMELDEAWLVDKLTRRSRGGFCYELNGAFAVLLENLGYAVERRSARVFRDDGSPGPPFDHLTLVVRCPSAGDGPDQWLVDVGFGDSFVRPLPLVAGVAFDDPAGRFELIQAADGDLDLRRDGTPTYRIDPRSYELADFGPTWWYHRTSPESGFTRGPVCTRLVGDGRVTLAGRSLVVTRNGERQERTVVDDAELAAIYRDRFGIELDRLPASRER